MAHLTAFDFLAEAVQDSQIFCGSGDAGQDWGWANVSAPMHEDLAHASM